MARLIVTAAPPTSNGDLHIGHLSGPYLGADVLARVRRQLGDDVLYVSYSDDYQDYVQRKAVETGSTPQDVARHYAGVIANTLAKANIVYDNFLRTLDNPLLEEALHTFYNAAKADGALHRRKAPVPYHEKGQLWGYEAFARGTCPNCGASTDTSQCEGCAFPPVIEDMHDLRCVLDGGPMARVEVEQIFLDMEKHRDLLKGIYANARFRPQLRAFCDQLLASELRPWAISRPHAWGPAVPDDPNASLHTWFGGICGYYAASREWAQRIGQPDKWRDYWEDPQCSIVHFIGFDCSFSHAVAYPSLLSHLPEAPRVRQILTNYFLNLEGQGFSTSRGLAIWANEFLDHVEADALRYYLALHAPENAEGDFNLADFQETVNRDLHQTFAEAKNKTGHGVARDISDLETELEPIRAAFAAASTIEGFSLNGMARSLQDLTAMIRRARPDEIRPLLAVYATMARALQPEFAEKLCRYLRLDPDWGSQWLASGGKLPDVHPSAQEGPEPSFAKVEDATVRHFQDIVNTVIQKTA